MNSKPFRKSLFVFFLLGQSAAVHADVFGVHGDNGSPGAVGNAGVDGPAITITATGETQHLNLRGQQGGNGGNGINGNPAFACEQTLGARKDLLGAPGGTGGDAGAGGKGGSGGLLAVYYQDIKNLKNILVDSTPGPGGYPGLPGFGGGACGCEVRHWDIPVQVCQEPAASPSPAPSSPPPQVVCHIDQEKHECVDGDPGLTGKTAQNGAAGSFGSVALIQSATPLTATQPSTIFQVGAAPSYVTLSMDRWATSTGATQLFAPGSAVSDTFSYWTGRALTAVSMVWNAARDKTPFANQQIQVSTDMDGRIAPTVFSGGMLAEMSVRYDPSGAARVSIDKAILMSESEKLSGKIYGFSTGTIVQLTDAAMVSEVVQTGVYAKVVIIGSTERTIYDGTVPADLIAISPTNVTVEIGKLDWISLADLARGKHLRVILTITRFLGGTSTVLELTLDQKQLGGPVL